MKERRSSYLTLFVLISNVLTPETSRIGNSSEILSTEVMDVNGGKEPFTGTIEYGVSNGILYGSKSPA